MAATSMAVEMLKLLLLLLLLLLEDAKSSWDSESPCASFTGESFFLVHRHLESHVAVQPFPLPPLLPLTLLLFSLVFFAYGACFSLGVLFAYSFALGGRGKWGVMRI